MRAKKNEKPRLTTMFRAFKRAYLGRQITGGGALINEPKAYQLATLRIIGVVRITKEGLECQKNLNVLKRAWTKDPQTLGLVRPYDEEILRGLATRSKTFLKRLVRRHSQRTLSITEKEGA